MQHAQFSTPESPLPSRMPCRVVYRRKAVVGDRLEPAPDATWGPARPRERPGPAPPPSGDQLWGPVNQLKHARTPACMHACTPACMHACMWGPSGDRAGHAACVGAECALYTAGLPTKCWECWEAAPAMASGAVVPVSSTPRHSAPPRCGLYTFVGCIGCIIPPCMGMGMGIGPVVPGTRLMDPRIDTV